ATAPAVAGEVSNKQVLAAGTHFQFIKLRTRLEPMVNDDFFDSQTFYALLALPFLCILLLFLFRKIKKAIDAEVMGNKTKRSNKLAKRYLSEAKKQFHDREQFYITLERAMHNFLKAKLAMETSDMSKQNIRELLHERGAEADTIADFIS